jgi:hypothetical protein
MKLRNLIPVVCLLGSINCLQGCSRNLEANAGFGAGTRVYLIKGCGNTLTENSSCDGTCAYLPGGAAATTVAQCTHGCVTLPAGKSDKDMNIAVSAAVDNDDHYPPPDQNYKACGSTNVPGPCGIGWSRFEIAEYYPSTNQMCAKVKNWSADQGVSFKISVWQK